VSFNTFTKRKSKLPDHTKEELSEMVKSYFDKGKTIKVGPVRYAQNYYRATLTSIYKQK